MHIGLLALSLVIVGCTELDGNAVALIWSKVAFVWFLVWGRLKSSSFWMYPATVALAFVALVLHLDVEAAILQHLPQLLVPFLAFAMAVGVLRFLIGAVYENIKLLRGLGWKGGSVATAKSVLYWSPLLLIAMPALLIDARIRTAAVEAIYETEGIKRSEPPQGLPHDLRQAVRDRLQTTADRSLAEVRKMQSRLLEKSRYEPDRFRTELANSFDQVVLKDLGMKRASGGGWNPVKRAGAWGKNAALDEVDRAYAAARANAREKLLARAGALEDDFNRRGRNAATQVPVLLKPLRESLEAVNRATQLAITQVAGYYAAWQVITFLLFAFLCVRSFMYVFGRVAFAKDSGAVIALTDTAVTEPTTAAADRIVCHGTDFTLPRGECTDYFFRRTLEAKGKPPVFAIPQPKVGFVSRILRGVWTMNRFAGHDDGPPVRFTTVHGAEFVEWRLEEGETVVFDYANFAGMSSGVTLSVLISLRASTLMFGRLVFPIARGPGTLILHTLGRPDASDDGQNQGSIPPSRLVAWHRDADFAVHAAPGIVDTYLSAAYVQQNGHGSFILDADKRDPAKNGLTRFIKYFLWPL